MNLAKPGHNSTPPPFSVLDAQVLLETTPNMENQRALGLRAINHAPIRCTANAAHALPPPAWHPTTIDPFSPLGVLEEHLWDKKRTSYMSPSAAHCRLRRTSFDWTQEAIRVNALLSVFLGQITPVAEPVAVRDSTDERIPVAGGVDGEVASVAENDRIRRIAVGATADTAHYPVLLDCFLCFFQNRVVLVWSLDLVQIRQRRPGLGLFLWGVSLGFVLGGGVERGEERVGSPDALLRRKTVGGGGGKGRFLVAIGSLFRRERRWVWKSKGRW